MQREDRAWALGVLGIQEPFTHEDLDKVYLEMHALWSPHLESPNEKAQQRGQEEIAKIDRAKEILLAPEAEPERSRGLNPVTLGVLVVAAFLGGFGGMYLYRALHPADVNVVIPKSALASAPKVHLNAPDVTVSSQRELSPEAQQAEADLGRVNEDLSGFGGDDPSGPINDLTSMGTRAVPGLTAALSSHDPDTRKDALAVLNVLAQKDEDGSEGYRQAFKDSNTLKAASRLAEDEDSETRQTVAQMVGYMGDTDGLPTLDKLSTDDDPDVRLAVETSLDELNSIYGIHILATLLSDPESSIRQAAATSLGKFNSVKEAHDALTDRLLHEDDDDVKKAILAALGLPTDIDERDL